MLTLAAPEAWPRLAYAWQVLGRLLGPQPVRFEADPSLDGLEIRFEGRCLLRLPQVHRLLQTGFNEPIQPQRTGESLTFLQDGHPLGGDPFALTFWYLTEYETRFDFPRDAHGRPVDAARLAVQLGLHHEPLLHRVAEQLGDLLKQAHARLPLERPPFRWEMGFDLDWPYRYRGRPAGVHAVAFVRDLARFDLSSARRRFHFFIKKEDPYDVYDFIFNLFLEKKINPEHHLLFFGLLSAGHRFDTPYTDRNPAYRQLLRQLAASGAVVGIHPSYAAAERPELIGEQVARLGGLLGRPVIHSRQHFLRLRVPETYRALLAAGITHDYTGCFSTVSGWRFGTSVPFPWYDLERELATDLWIHPVAAMDRALLDHECHTADASLIRLVDLARSCRRWGGTFHVLLHNDTLSECPPWEGWRQVVVALLDELMPNSGP